MLNVAESGCQEGGTLPLLLLAIAAYISLRETYIPFQNFNFFRSWILWRAILPSLTTDHPKYRTHYSQVLYVAAVANIAVAKS